jgi:hypothetical protein
MSGMSEKAASRRQSNASTAHSTPRAGESRKNRIEGAKGTLTDVDIPPGQSSRRVVNENAATIIGARRRSADGTADYSAGSSTSSKKIAAR